MKHTTHALEQGSPEWLAHRANCYNASDLAAAAGDSSYTTRTDLIRKLATGIEPEIDPATQRRFDDGHRCEALARPLAEEIIGDTLYPISVSVAVDGLARPLGASLDGATAGDETNFEHKRLNVALTAALDQCVIPDEYHWQMEQGQLINGATRTLFMASNWEKAPGHDEEPGRIYGEALDENGDLCRYVLVAEKHCWYEPNPELRAKIVPTWRQTEADAASYQHVEVIPAAVAEPQEHMPAISVVVTGSVSVIDNLDVFKDALHKYIDGINRKPQTDDDFATVKAASQRLREVQTRIAAQKENLVGQVASVDTVLRAATELEELARVTAIELEKLHDAENKNRKQSIIMAGPKALSEYVASLNARIGKPYMPTVASDFAGKAKNLRSLDSMQNAIDTELARCKIDADQIAARIEVNLKTLRDLAKDHASLFADTAQLVLKDTDAVEAIVKSRIAEYLAAEEKRIESERAKIRAEEEAKAAAKVKAEKDAEAERVRELQHKEEVTRAVNTINALTSQVAPNTPAEAPNIAQVAPSVDADEPAIWRNAKQSVVVMLDALTISELNEVANFISRKAWRKAA